MARSSKSSGGSTITAAQHRKYFDGLTLRKQFDALDHILARMRRNFEALTPARGQTATMQPAAGATAANKRTRKRPVVRSQRQGTGETKAA